MTRFVLLLAACTGLDEAEIQREEQVRDDMVEHQTYAADMRDALIQGDLTTARTKAGMLEATFTAEGLPTDALPLVTEIKATLTGVAAATDLSAASLGAGRAAQTCGRCHTATDGGPQPPTDPPPHGDGLKVEMARHQWAAERMWLGLVRNDELLFREGVLALSEAPLVPTAPSEGSTLPVLATELERGVHELALGAAAATTPEVRGEKYGEMLVTCAACHTLLRDAPSE